jgi:hypothetical protein
MKVWISKYALTQGIFEVEVEDCGNGMVKDNTRSFQGYYHGNGKEWHITKTGAINMAEFMKNNKINLLRKQIDKLRALKFD